MIISIHSRLNRLTAMIPEHLTVVCKLPTGEEAHLTVDECIAAKADPIRVRGGNLKEARKLLDYMAGAKLCNRLKKDASEFPGRVLAPLTVAQPLCMAHAGGKLLPKAGKRLTQAHRPVATHRKQEEPGQLAPAQFLFQN